MSMDVSEISKSMQRFSWPDYMVFVIMLISCMCIGVYYGWQDHQKHKNNKMRRGSEALDYLVGGRKMKVFPVAMSLVASFISGISLLGTSTEVYVYGTQYCYIFIAIVLTGIVLHYVYLPVYHELQLTSTYEYLDRRFDRRLRLFGSIIFLITTTIWIPIVIYVPALAFNQVTGVNIHIITPVVCLVCIFYTSVGGLKAVVWTDVVQTFVMLGALIVVATKATIELGGLGAVLSKNFESGRIEGPIMDIDPTIRHSAFSVVIGGWIYWVSVNCTNQAMVQRYLSLPSITQAKKAVWFFVVGIIVLLSFCAYNGLLLYAMYHDCDPLTTKLAKQKDQLVPLLVMNVLGEFPGLTGCFVAGVFSAALSSLSTGLNSLAAVILEDFVKPFHSERLSEKATAFIMRFTVVLFGLIAVALVFVVQHLGQVLQLSMSLSGATLGPMLGIYTIGLFMPTINSKNTLIGASTALAAIFWITMRAQYDLASGVLRFDTKPTSVAGCTYTFNITVPAADDVPLTTDEYSRPMHHMSYLYYTTFGAVLTIVISFISSLILGKQDPNEVNPMLLAPWVRRFYKQEASNLANLPLSPSEVSCTTYNFEKEKLASVNKDENEEKMKQ